MELPQQEDKNQPKNFKNKVLPIILTSVGLIIVLLLIGVGALLASHRWDPLWNPFKQQNPDKGINVKMIKEKIFKK